ncbi:substrate-specific activator of APC-dependent proteolysis [Lobaria immixta]|nr:substrate-specific activator of APC-dependent proteolysis [Lobaria immixta]
MGDSHSPALVSPPEAGTPPLAIGRHGHTNVSFSNGFQKAGSEPIDAHRLSHALKTHEEAVQRRERTPGGSPSRKRQRTNRNTDRFIPQRQDLQINFGLLPDDSSPTTPSRAKTRTPQGVLDFQLKEEQNRTFETLLHNELFGSSIPQQTPPTLSPDPTLPPSTHSTTINDPSRSRTPPFNASSSSLPPSGLTPSTPHKRLFNYKSPQHHTNISGHPTPSRTPQSRHDPNLNPHSDIYSLSPVRLDSQRLLLTPRKAPRAVSKVPFKVLDAPDLADDFYLNLVDWGSSDILGVGLGSCVYMWNSASGRVTQLCDLQDDIVTSVSWIQRGSHISIGTNKGLVQIWDAERCQRLRTMTGHSARVGALAWNEHILTSGSRDRLIYHRDVRQPDQFLRKLVGHKQEVCGLRWNTEDGQLASGGNDNKLMVWDKLSETPLHKFSDHTAAVKAIAWSPHQHSLLASGGGTADRRIKFWNTQTGKCVQEIDTGSQVCNLAWSKNSNEIVSTHGYSQNQIVVWKYPSMTQVASLTGHTYRVLYLAMSPDGQTVVTGAGDETLRFWKCFGKRERDGVGGESAGAKMERYSMIR